MTTFEEPPHLVAERIAVRDGHLGRVEPPAPPVLASKLLTTAGLMALPPPDFLVGQWIPDNATTLEFGASGSGKTHVGFDVAAHVATGSWWHGHEVKAGRVVYVIAESAAGLGPRIDAWQRRHGLTIDDYHGISWIPEAVNLFDLVAAGHLRELVAEVQPRLVVIDTVHRNSAGMEENSAKDVGRFIEQVDLIRRAASCAVLLIHHSGKTADAGARGSSALRAAVDAELEVVGTDDRVTVKCTKQRNAGEPLPIHFRLSPFGESVVLEPARAGQDELPAAAAETLDALAAIDVPGGVSSSAWKAAADTSERTYYRHRAGLISDGRVVNIGTEASPRYRPASAIEGRS